MVLVGRAGLIGCWNGAWCCPHEAKFRIHPSRVNFTYEILNSRHIVSAAISRVDTVDSKPAVLVEWNPDEVGTPSSYGIHTALVHGAVFDTPALNAGILGA